MSTYASKYHVTFGARDGYTYRAEIQRRGWTGSSTPIPGGASPYRLRMGTQGGHALFDPVALSEVDLSIIDVGGYGIMQEIAGADDRAYRVVLLRIDGSGDVPLYQHYLDTRSYDEPTRLATKVVSLRATDGLDVLSNRRLVFGEGQASRYQTIALLDIIRQALSAVGSRGLSMAMSWYPYADIPIAGDPMAALRVYRRHLDGGPTEARLLDALKMSLVPFMLRLFQSSGRWYAVQRGTLEAGTLDRFEYDADGTLTASGETDVSIDMTDIFLSADPVRGFRPAVKSVAQSYRFSPAREEYIYNGSFTHGSGPESIDADGWTPVTAGSPAVNSRRVRIQEGPRGAPTSTYVWRLVDTATGVSPRNRVEQSGRHLVTADPSSEVTFSYTMTYVHAGAGVPSTDVARTRLAIGDSELVLSYAEVIREGEAGRSQMIIVTPIAIDEPNVVEETPLVPRGAQLGVWRGSSFRGLITLDRDVRALDTSIEYTSDISIDQGDEVAIPLWTDEGFIASREPSEHVPYAAYLVRPDGTSVSGWVEVWLLGRYADSPFDVVDYTNVSLSITGREDALAWQASRVIGDGYEDTLPDSLLGDGPELDSDSGIRLAGADRTWRGQQTGWRVGPYTAGEASTGQFLTDLAAREALYQQASILERIQTTLLLRNGQQYMPHNVLMYRQATRLSYAATSGADYIVTPTRLRPGRTITIGGETHTVTEVTGAGPYRADLGGTLASSYVQGTKIFYTTPAWWDFLEWDVRAGEMYFDGTELYRREVPYEADILIEGE